MPATSYSQFSSLQLCAEDDVLLFSQQHCVFQLWHVARSVGCHSGACPVLVLQAELSVSHRR